LRLTIVNIASPEIHEYANQSNSKSVGITSTQTTSLFQLQSLRGSFPRTQKPLVLFVFTRTHSRPHLSHWSVSLPMLRRATVAFD